MASQVSRPWLGSRLFGPEIRTAKRKDVLFEESRLAVDREVIGFKRRRGVRIAGRLRAVAVEPVVQPEAQFAEREPGIETLRAGRKGDAAIAVVEEQIFEPRRPVRRQGVFDAGASRAAEPRHHVQVLNRTRRSRAAGELRAGELVEGPGESAGGVKQPMAAYAEIWRVADAAAQRGGIFDLFGIAGEPRHRRGKRSGPADRIRK